MATISMLVNGHPAKVLAKVFVTAKKSDAIEFEVLQVDASSLHAHIGKRYLLSCDGDAPFWGELVSLEASARTVQGLRMMRNQKVLKGAIKIFTTHSERMQ